MKLKHLRSFLLLAVLFNASCTAYKQVPYFQDLRRDTVVNEKINNFSPFTLQPGDLIALNVTSLNRDADLIFNYNLVPLSQGQGGSSGVALPYNGQSTVYGYLVDHDGDIRIPMVGNVKVLGLTTNDAAAQIESKLQTYLSKPTVTIRMLNFKISVLGDVKNPGTFSIQNEKITITEALSFAGDLNTTGLRNNVLLIRENEGKREYVTLDLTSKKIFSSEYFYLKNNDILYVTPNRAKIASTDDGLTTKISLLVSSLALLFVILKK
jgi:polysaccharide export outer membrane protein